VTAHDGFTLRDLVSYNDKHNEANGEDNKDGESDNRSWNCGVEGPTDDAAVNELRSRQQRNFITTLLLSQGIPMLVGGDELGRTQQGNNNAYNQDNDVSWYDWEHVDDVVLAFASRIVHFRHDHPAFQRRRWFAGRALRGADVSDIGWFKPDGQQMTDDDWQGGFARSIGVFFSGLGIPPDPRGEEIIDDSFYLLFNAHYEAMPFRLPTGPWGERWEPVIDTNKPIPDFRAHEALHAGEEVEVEAYSMMVLRRLA
jgi:glycogen operon protein